MPQQTTAPRPVRVTPIPPTLCSRLIFSFEEESRIPRFVCNLGAEYMRREPSAQVVSFHPSMNYFVRTYGICFPFLGRQNGWKFFKPASLTAPSGPGLPPASWSVVPATNLDSAEGFHSRVLRAHDGTRFTAPLIVFIDLPVLDLPFKHLLYRMSPDVVVAVVPRYHLPTFAGDAALASWPRIPVDYDEPAASRK